MMVGMVGVVAVPRVGSGDGWVVSAALCLLVPSFLHLCSYHVTSSFFCVTRTFEFSGMETQFKLAYSENGIYQLICERLQMTLNLGLMWCCQEWAFSAFLTSACQVGLWVLSIEQQL